MFEKGWTKTLKDKFFKNKKTDSDNKIMFAKGRLENKIMEILVESAEKYEDVKEKTFTQILEESGVHTNTEWKIVKKVLDVFESVGLVECQRKTYLIYGDPEPKKAEERNYKLTNAGFIFALILQGLCEKFPFIEYQFVVKEIHSVGETNG